MNRCDIRVCGPRDWIKPTDGERVINTTSRSTGPSKGLSPFFLGPVEIFPGIISKNVENAWQFSKVYKQHTDIEGGPTQEWIEWCANGFNDSYAHRYPLGKGKKPLYSIDFATGDKLGYVEARKKIYCPIYYKAAVVSKAYSWLVDQTKKYKRIWLWDFDGYDHLKYGMTFKDVLNSPTKKMGHGFVLAMMLENDLCWLE